MLPFLRITFAAPPVPILTHRCGRDNLFLMRRLSESTAIRELLRGRRALAHDIAERYETKARPCSECTTPGICCLDAHFVNVRITRLETAAVRRALNELPEAARDAVQTRARDAVERFKLDAAASTTYACPLFEKGVGCLVHNTAKPAPCILHACYDRPEDLPPDSLLQTEEARTANLDRRTYGRLTLTPIPVALLK